MRIAIAREMYSKGQWRVDRELAGRLGWEEVQGVLARAREQQRVGVK